MSDYQRIEKIRKAYNFRSDRSLAIEIGINVQVFYDIKSEKCKISHEIAVKILDKFKNINKDWLLYGVGEMLKQEENNFESTNIESASYKLVPMYNFDAVGGVDNDEVDCKPYIVDHIAFQDAREGDICMPVSGRSMLPTFAPGAIVLLRQVHLWKEYLELGQIYVLVLKDGRRLLKEVRRSEEDRINNFLLMSHNAEFDPTEIAKDFIVEVYLVKAMYQNLTI